MKIVDQFQVNSDSELALITRATSLFVSLFRMVAKELRPTKLTSVSWHRQHKYHDEILLCAQLKFVFTLHLTNS